MRRLVSLSILAVSAVGAQAAILDVTPGDMQGWQFSATGGTASGSLVNGPATPPLGSGSAQFLTGSNGDGAMRLRHGGFAGTRLDALTELSYSTYQTASSFTGLAIYMQVYVDYNNDGLWNINDDDILFFEPEYQHGYTGDVPDQGDVVNGAWQGWNALSGGWWSLNNIAGSGGAGTNVATLGEILLERPDATIVNPSGVGGIRLTAGFGAPTWNNFDGNVDAFTIGTAAGSSTYNFEAVPEPATMSILGASMVAMFLRRRKKA